MKKEKVLEIIEKLEALKLEHELPNGNTGDYNVGYVKAICTAMHLVKNCTTEWTPITKLPERRGYYECYFPDSKAYEEHHSERWFNGKCFKAGSIWTFGSDKSGKDISKYISHWIEIGRPD